MLGKTLIAALIANAIVVQGAIVEFYAGPNCGGSPFNTRNIYDNSCATGTGGYQSFRITSGGGSGQKISTYSRDACAGTSYACVGAGDVGTCCNSYGNNFSGSNAISSGPVCGAF